MFGANVFYKPRMNNNNAYFSNQFNKSFGIYCSSIMFSYYIFLKIRSSENSV